MKHFILPVAIVSIFSQLAFAVVDGRVVGQPSETSARSQLERQLQTRAQSLRAYPDEKPLPSSEDRRDPKFDRLMLERTVRIGMLDEAGNFEPNCTGVIRKNGEVASAGHCVYGGKGRLGPGNGEFKENDLAVQIYDPATKTYRTVRVESGKFVFDQRMDFLQLKVPTGPKNYPEISLATEGCEDGEVFAAGFGAWNWSGKMSKKLRIARLDARLTSEELDITEAQLRTRAHRNFYPYPRGRNIERIEYEGQIRDNRIRAVYADDSRVCPGDSGGPIYCRSKGKYALAGITSAIHNGQELNGPVGRDHVCRQFGWVSGVSAIGIRNIEAGISDRDRRVRETQIQSESIGSTESDAGVQ